MTEAFLRIPPFPGARPFPLSQPGRSRFAPEAVHAALVQHKVGGTFWAAAPVLPADCTAILVPGNQAELAAMLAAAGDSRVAVALPPGLVAPAGVATLREPFDPWQTALAVEEVWGCAREPLARVAALLGRRVRAFGPAGPVGPAPDTCGELLRELAERQYQSPFDGTAWSLEQVICQLGAWRRLLEANRRYAAIYGVARWKRVTVDPMLWDGTGPVRHRAAALPGLDRKDCVLAWKSRTAPRVLAALETSGARIAELEDGMIRSVGLGANCVPPLSVITDEAGVYFDPNSASKLEQLLQSGELPAGWVERAASLQATLVASRISKYGKSDTRAKAPPFAAERTRQILVTGQVEDDRSVLSGGANCTNLDLIARARALEPDAWIIYKPHPDVEAGHRKGHVPDGEALRHADEIDRGTPIAELLERVDGIHVITSLAGFEALLRGKPVTTHGQPFYAGWGLTRDLGPANPRRTRQRSLAELVAATLIGYARYVDPVTRLPCPPELLLHRIAAGRAQVKSPLVTLREWQGRLRLGWQRLSGVRA